ncbi:hypothetical protein AB0F91_44120 [Amycolatopsis sp. NPDC023774]|uniref:hypothetical protein n=1 Tax=Amycolatopsis sp. NPDC023774 TaxID=3155015 RepID=UPI0033C6FE34
MTMVSLALHARDVPILTDAATESDLAYGHLADCDPIMRLLVGEFGHPDPFGKCEEAGMGDHFAALVRYASSLPPQVSSTSTLYVRIRRATQGFPSAVKVAALGAGRLAALGLPYEEADRLVRLARAQLDCRVDLNTLSGRNDRQVRALLADYGISQRVAELFLIRRLNRPDVLPVDDRVIAEVIGHTWLRSSAPGAGLVNHLGLRWAPFRTYAAALLWTLSRAEARTRDLIVQRGRGVL